MNYTRDTMPDGTIYENYEGTPQEIGDLVNLIKQKKTKYDMYTDIVINGIVPPTENIVGDGEYVFGCPICEEIVDEGQYFCHNCGQHLLQSDENI